MKKKVQYRYEEIKRKLDDKWASPRGPQKLEELKKKCQIYREQTGESFYAYHAVVLVYDIGLDGGQHSYRNAAKVINSTIIGDPKRWISDTMVHDQKYIGLLLLGIDIKYDVDVRRKGKKVEDAWRKYQKVQELKAELPAITETKEIVHEEKWESKIINDATKHLQWLKAERSQVVPIVAHLQKDLAQWQGYLKTIQRLLEIETEELKLLRELEDGQCKYWRDVIMASD